MRNDTRRDVQKQRINQNQYNLVEQYAQNKLLDSICLDQLIRRYVRQTGSVVDTDDLSRLLDGRTKKKHFLGSEEQSFDDF